mmetsp:Transcript_40594/g.63532  ORF Transcript_40594/g.63532 Transcript_40594/m.63532 type:complete len:353 (-) Transcript_40594:110-1168(-)
MEMSRLNDESCRGGDSLQYDELTHASDTSTDEGSGSSVNLKMVCGTAAFDDFLVSATSKHDIAPSLSDGVLQKLPTRMDNGCDFRMARTLSEPSRLTATSDFSSKAPQRCPTWRQLGIPRSMSDYFEKYRFARAHSDGISKAHSIVANDFSDCRLPLRAFSEGLCGGRLFLCNSPDAHDANNKQETKKKQVRELRQGDDCEGKITKCIRAGLLIDIGAAKCGFLPTVCAKDIPQHLRQVGVILSCLRVHSINLKRKRFTLRLRAGDCDQCLEMTSYSSLMSHIASWANVSLWGDDCLDKKINNEGKERIGSSVHLASTPTVESYPWPCRMTFRRRASSTSNILDAALVLDTI